MSLDRTKSPPIPDPRYYPPRAALYWVCINACDGLNMSFNEGTEWAGPAFDRYDAVVRAALLRELADELENGGALSRCSLDPGGLDGYMLGSELRERAAKAGSAPSGEQGAGTSAK